jgi:hypothetical protein
MKIKPLLRVEAKILPGTSSVLSSTREAEEKTAIKECFIV